MADTETQTSGRRRLDLGGKPTPAPDANPEPAAVAAPEATGPVDVYAAPAPLAAVVMKAPDNSAPFLLEGDEYAPDAEGLVEVPHRHVTTLRAHGFVAL